MACRGLVVFGSVLHAVVANVVVVVVVVVVAVVVVVTAAASVTHRPSAEITCAQNLTTSG